ncbi:hypothetical protein EVC11_029 [Rhizobium phage RHph_I20]|uniref:Uncharacterized protein n=1 Tax=Rhizobium phage RHph_I20 TaxID=2509730 RepID=A0A7S5RFL9_9CAUD|nr:hypothetical protein EVC11_029 [Rhizobium phage RHph_I20]
MKASIDHDTLNNAAADDVIRVALTIADTIQHFDQHVRLAGAMLFLQTCAELTGTSPQDVATVAGNIRSFAERDLLAPGQHYRGLVNFLQDDVMRWREEIAEEEGIELA